MTNSISATNAIQNTVENLFPGVDFLSSAVRQAATLSNEAVFVGFLLAFNWMLKKSPKVYDELIPVVSVAASTIVYPLLFGFSVRAFLIGFSVGCVPIGIHQSSKQLGILRERRRTGDTQTIKKTDVTTTP